MSNTPISVKESYAHRHIFLAGGSGFLGKVWLAMALESLPSIGRLYVLIRPGVQISARKRLENILNTSPVFKRLHEKLGPYFSHYISTRIEVIEGDLTEYNLGIKKHIANRLQRELDIVLNCAGQVDFTPDLRKALSSNVDATQRLIDFVKKCDHAALIHVSTCYVAGNYQGSVTESLSSNPAIAREDFVPQLELAEARKSIERICAAQHSSKVQLKLESELKLLLANRPTNGGNGNGNNTRLKKSYTRRWLRENLRKEMVEEGKRRANRWGWQNTYTYTKGIAESIVASQLSETSYTIARPSIIESSLAFPFPGWNQGFNASAPLSYLLGTWFHRLPAKRDVPFDVVPVDMVCRSLMVIGAALMAGRHAQVYHIGTSERNRFTLGRACELTDLGHRRYLREKGSTTAKRVLLSRWDTKVVESDHFFSTKNLRRITSELSELLDDFPQLIRKRSGGLSNKLHKVDKQLHEIQDLLEAYQPFIYDNFQVFIARAIDCHPPIELEFTFSPEEIDWRRYWIEIHMEGLRRWVFPQFEGRSREVYHPDFPVQIPDEAVDVPSIGKQETPQLSL